MSRHSFCGVWAVWFLVIYVASVAEGRKKGKVSMLGLGNVLG